VIFSDLRANAHGYEQFRTLRSNLLQLRDTQALKTVLVTSALPQEGKTFIALNLAHAVVRQRETRALLIDADLRYPRLHLSLGAPASPGLSEYLRGAAQESALLQRGPLENLFFLPGGATVPNAAELLVNGRLKRLLEWLSPAFDWIILDSPPAIPVSDARLLADHCDGVLMVVSAGMTPFDLAQKVRQQFRDKRLLGVVLNRAKWGSTYGSYYYYGYGDKRKNNGKK
jgi:capsular exopolysaccharide synthesis family protein